MTNPCARAPSNISSTVQASIRRSFGYALAALSVCLGGLFALDDVTVLTTPTRTRDQAGLIVPVNGPPLYKGIKVGMTTFLLSSSSWFLPQSRAKAPPKECPETFGSKTRLRDI